MVKAGSGGDAIASHAELCSIVVSGAGASSENDDGIEGLDLSNIDLSVGGLQRVGQIIGNELISPEGHYQ